MARANTTTWLPLDEWAHLMGYNLFHFNGISVGDCQLGESCGNFWRQYPFQHDSTSREELAAAIRSAEEIIANFVGYNLLPDWGVDTLRPSRFYDPLYKANATPRGRPKSIQLTRGFVISGGYRRKAEIQLSRPITRIDKDGDGFNETAQITLTADLSDIADDEIHVYYPGEVADDRWEIRPIEINGNVITFPIWLIVQRQYLEQNCPDELDGTTDIYLDEVDVYRVYNDDSEQAQLIWEPDASCSTDCEETSTTNCIYIKDPRLGYVVYNPKLYQEPDRVSIKYYSGYQADRGQVRPKAELDHFWKDVISKLAASLMDKEAPNCCGGNESLRMSKWAELLDESERDIGRFSTIAVRENGFGVPTRGAWYAFTHSKTRKIR